MQGLSINWQQKAASRMRDNRRMLDGIKGKRKGKVLQKLPDFHRAAFSRIDCRQCAGCCKTISPRFKTPDIRRIAKFLQLKESVLIDTYLTLDEDGDYVVKSTPCPFLGKDNLCGIYEARPGDCRHYPYTDRGVLLSRPAITCQNSTICPAVYDVLERIREYISGS